MNISRPINLFFLLLILLSSQASLADKLNCDQPQTQADRSQCAESPLMKAETKLKQSLEALKKKKADNPIFLKKLISSQEAWEKYLSAHMEALFPAEDKQASYGSVFSMCYGADKLRLIEKRIQELEELLKYPLEGDVCGFR